MSNLDIDPVRGPVPRLVGIIQKLNADLESAQSRLQREAQRLEEEYARYQKLSKEYWDLQNKYLCIDCKLHLRTTPPGETIYFCETCEDIKDTIVLLCGGIQRLGRELETLERHERHDDGSGQ